MLKQLGRYTIVSELGSGGMGKVYQAVTPSGRSVAVKVVHPYLVSTPGFFKRFVREGELGRKVSHANVVRTLDMDSVTVDGTQISFLVMEYVRGKSLRELLRELGTVPETLLREIALQLTAGLAAIHAAGVIHRDLKPENVLISRDHTVRIMDLGVAKMQETSVALTLAGRFAGSYAYAAPEQFEKDAEVGPAADLYALGVVLYELATGTNPYQADNVAAIMENHRTVDPPRLSDRAPEVSSFFAEIVHTLLSKRPADRFAGAAELNRILDQGELSEWWRERERSLRRGAARRPAIHVRRECSLRGREKEMKVLADAWERARMGEGSVLLFEGEAGIGKTRLLDAFVEEAASDDAHVLYGAYTPGGGIGGLSEAVLGMYGSVNLAEGLAHHLPETPALVVPFAAYIRHEAPPPGVQPLQLDALHTVGCNLFRNLAAEKPALWALDDLHFAPSESLHFLVALARTLATQRTLLVVTARTGGLESHLAHFARVDRFRRQELSRLSPHEVSEMLGETLRSEGLVQRIAPQVAEKSDGVPLFVLEIARGIREAGGGDDAGIAVPSAVRDLIGARLQGLSDEERNLIDCAAVQGFSFDPDLVARALESKPIQVLQRLAALERRTGVVRAHGSGYRFDHHQIQEVLYADQPDALRTHYHTLTADAFEARARLSDAATPPGAAAYFMADHRLRGTDPSGARRYIAAALAHVDNDQRSDAYIQLCARAVATPGLLDDTERCKAMIRKASMHGQLGQRSRQGATLDEAVRVADGIGDIALRCDARSHLGWYFLEIGRYPEARAVFEGALRVAEDPEQRRRLSGRLADVLSMLGHTEEALKLDQPRANNRGLCHQNLGQYAQALACFEDADRNVTEPAARPVIRLNIGRMQALLGDPETARATIDAARTDSRALGLRRPEGYALHRLGEVAEQTGNLKDAAALYSQALALRRAIEYPSGIAESLLALGRVKQREGTDGTLCLEEARKIARDIDRPDELVLSDVYLGGGAAAEAALQSLGPRMRVRERMEAHFELWKATGNAAHLDEARRLHAHLLEHAPPGRREAMLAHVPLHAAIASA